mmetsp:Transcript_8497/g.21799  ORF Transcript_8497/g.21799 Transcript_8497/m.21799 type:complete len:242 (+) Transcript_8497:1010-1735(+)
MLMACSSIQLSHCTRPTRKGGTRGGVARGKAMMSIPSRACDTAEPRTSAVRCCSHPVAAALLSNGVPPSRAADRSVARSARVMLRSNRFATTKKLAARALTCAIARRISEKTTTSALAYMRTSEVDAATASPKTQSSRGAPSRKHRSLEHVTRAGPARFSSGNSRKAAHVSSVPKRRSWAAGSTSSQLMTATACTRCLSIHSLTRCVCTLTLGSFGGGSVPIGDSTVKMVSDGNGSADATV